MEGIDDLKHLVVQRQKDHLEPTDYTFQPNIGNAALILQYSRLQEGNEQSLDERLERLSQRDSLRRCGVRQRISVSFFGFFKSETNVTTFIVYCVIERLVRHGEPG
jgi:hypothetical protein